MTRFKGPVFPSWKDRPQPFPTMAQALEKKPAPDRSLPPGKQWIGHDLPRGQAAARRRRQAQRLAKKRLARTPAPAPPPRVVAIIQARLGSERFPAKILADLHGRPVLQHVIERAQRIEGVTEVVVAMPPGEDAHIGIVAVGLATGVPIIAPDVPETDVLARFAAVARARQADVIVRITADCPVLDWTVSSTVLQRFLATGAFTSNDVTVSGWPDGFDTEVFSRAMLEQAHDMAVDPYDREHVTPYLKRTEDCDIVMRPDTDGPSPLKWSVDTDADLERIAALTGEGAQP